MGATGAITVAALAGYVGSQRAAGEAADAQRDAAAQASATQRYIYDQTRADQAPWRQAGQQALGQLQGQLPELTKNFTMADFQQDPGYQFRLAEGQKAIARAASARGGAMGGATLKSLTNFSQGLASDEFQNAYNRFNTNQTNTYNKLAGVAGVGQAATNQIGQAGQNYANNVSGNQMAAGNATAGQAIAGANNLNNLIGTGTNTWMNMSMMNRMFPQQQQALPQPSVTW